MNTTRGIAMTNRMRQLRPRDAVLFVAVAALVAVLGVMIGRELGIGQETGASVTPAQSDQSGPTPQQQSEETTALTLTLSAPEICETERGRGYAGQVFVYDDDGKAIGTRDISTGWDDVAEIPVRWGVTGGTAPYTLVIDDETRDGDGPYEGASGIASVSCAVTSAEVFYTSYNERRFRGDPEIDSGPKTIRVTVTDANSATANASVGIYVILQLSDSGHFSSGEYQSHRLNAGRTYRYNGFLYTVPQGITIMTGGSAEVQGGSWEQLLWVEGTDIILVINRHGEELYRELGSKLVFPGPVPAAVDAAIDAVQAGPDLDLDTAHQAISDYLDEFVASRDKLPVTE